MCTVKGKEMHTAHDQGAPWTVGRVECWGNPGVVFTVTGVPNKHGQSCSPSPRLFLKNPSAILGLWESIV